MGFLSLRILFPYLGHGTVHPARAETRQQPLTRKFAAHTLNLCIFTVKMDIFLLQKTLAMYGNA